MDFFLANQGEFAALATALCWTFTALSFEAAGKRVGSLPVNLIRLVIAFFLLAGFCWIYRSTPFPSDATFNAWFWLGLSGILGFTIGDLCFFRSLVVVGTRIASLVMLTLAPPMAALIGWLVLGEQLELLDWFGMALTVGGVAWVVTERRRNGNSSEGQGSIFAGVLLALVGAAGQASGAVVSKIGMRDIDPAGATQIRVIAGIAGFVLIFTIIRWWPKVLAAFKDRVAVGQISAGAVMGPFLGVTLFQAALVFTQAGIAQTITALVPVLVIPFAYMFFRRKANPRAIIGAAIAVSGVALLFVR
ncbi:MAG: DMT family transporter [Planctomycetota bacterium]|nr:DMT family transporter [Planctomycetota bacterium]